MINIFNSKLNNLGASSVNCSITIGNITGFFEKNCNINISNSCLNNQAIINSLLLSSLSEILNIISDDNIKRIIMNSLGIDSMTDLPSSTFQSHCESLALVNNSINILQLNFSHCIASEPVTLNFINTGDAMSACGLSSILNAFIDANNYVYEDVPKQDNTFFIYIILGLFILSSFLLIILYFKQKQNVIYKIDYMQKDNTNLHSLIHELKTIVKNKNIN